MPDPALSGPATCPRCGMALEPHQKFCDGCGLELPHPVATAPRGAPPPKRKRTRRAAPAPDPVPPAAEAATWFLSIAPTAPADSEPPAPSKRKRTRKAASPAAPVAEQETRFLPDLAPPAEPPAAPPVEPPAEPPAPPKRKRTRKATPTAAPATEQPARFLPDAAPPAEPPAPPPRKRTRRAPAAKEAPAPAASPGTQFLPDVPPEPGTQVLPGEPPPAPPEPAPAVTRHLEVAAPVAPYLPPASVAPAKPRRPRRRRRAAGTAPVPAASPAPAASPHIMPHGARRGSLPAPALIILLGIAIIVLGQAARGLFGPGPAPTPLPAPTLTGPPRFQVVPPTQASRRPTATPEGAVGNLDIVASTSYRDRAGTLCLVGVIGNDLDVGLGAEVTAALVDAGGATLAEARSHYYPSGLLTPGVRLPFRMELAHPPPAWSDIRWGLSAFDVSGEAETVYHGLQAVDTELRPPTGPAAPWTLAGQIANTGARDARPLRLYAAVYDAAGALLDANEVDGPPAALAPGTQAPFTLSLPRPDMQPARAEVVIEGH